MDGSCTHSALHMTTGCYSQGCQCQSLDMPNRGAPVQVKHRCKAGLLVDPRRLLTQTRKTYTPNTSSSPHSCHTEARSPPSPKLAADEVPPDIRLHPPVATIKPPQARGPKKKRAQSRDRALECNTPASASGGSGLGEAASLRDAGGPS